MLCRMIEIEWGGRRYRSRAAVASDLAIPLVFDGHGPIAFGAVAARAEPLATEDFSGRVADGASCNASVLHLTPHGNGTHTESLGHLVEDSVPVPLLIAGGWMPGWLASVEVTGDVISAAVLKPAIVAARATGATAFMLRTLPNDTDKLERRYTAGDPPTWFTAEAAAALAEANVEHLLVDLPSLDRLDDRELRAHRAFFGLPAGARRARDAKRRQATVTELIYVADELHDGLYLLDLQVPRWQLEAVPSRPLVVPAELV